MLISIVGASGSGKSFISKMLCDFKDNILIIDIDKIGHEVLTYDSVKEELIKAFGKEILVFVISLMPILELRGGLIAAALLKMNPVVSYIISIIGNVLPVPFILLLMTNILTK